MWTVLEFGLTVLRPVFTFGLVFENEDDAAVFGSTVNRTVFTWLELFHTCTGNVMNGASPGDGLVLFVTGVVTNNPSEMSNI